MHKPPMKTLACFNNNDRIHNIKLIARESKHPKCQRYRHNRDEFLRGHERHWNMSNEKQTRHDHATQDKIVNIDPVRKMIYKEKEIGFCA